MNPLNHVAIIMDGNGRWGLKFKNSRNAGHKEGLNTVELFYAVLHLYNLVSILHLYQELAIIHSFFLGKVFLNVLTYLLLLYLTHILVPVMSVFIRKP